MAAIASVVALTSFINVAHGSNPRDDLWTAIDRHVEIGAGQVDEARAAANRGGVRHLLVLSEDWCGDAVNIVPWVARLVAMMPGVDLRVLGRDALHLHPIALAEHGPGLADAGLPRAEIGQHHQPLAVVVEAAGRVHILDCNEVAQTAATAGGAELRQHRVRLVE